MTKSLLPDHRRSSSHLLARILAAPDLPAQVQALPARALAELIGRVGLEDAGELIAFATTTQLAQVFDEDLWRNARPGEEERFDARRFLLWLSVMLEAGDSFVAERLLGLPPDLVVLAFHRQILVLRTEATFAAMQAPDAEAEAADKLLEGSLSEEFGDYLLVSRNHDGWDDVFTALLALDREDHEFAMDLLERCCLMTADLIEDSGGLYEVLSSDEMLEADVGGEREDRRAAAGYVEPSAAAGFLKLARDAGAEATGRDWLTEVYFRRQVQPGLDAGDAQEAPPRGDVLLLLQEAGVVDAGPPPLLLEGSENRGAAPPLMIRMLQRLAEVDSGRFASRNQEVGYLANVLLAGCSFRGRRLRPIEAVHAVIATCSLGLELAAGHAAGSAADDSDLSLLDRSADLLFRVGWQELNREVIQAAAETAQQWMRAAAARADEPDAGELRRAASRVQAATAAAAPWKALAALETMLTHFEAADVDLLRGLMDECPTLGGDLRPDEIAGGEHHFIASTADLSRARDFLRRRPAAI